MTKNLKSKKEVPEKLRKKWGACEHDKVSYLALEKLNNSLLIHCKRLSRDIDRKGALIEEWTNSRQRWIDKINKDLLTKTQNHNKYTQELKDYYEEELAEVKKLYEEAVEHNREMSEVNRDAIKTNKEIIKSHNEITRAYNGLHTIGEMAQDLGIDIKKHNKMLPENSDDFQFEQKHTLLENGKVRHEYKVSPKKKKKEIN